MLYLHISTFHIQKNTQGFRVENAQTYTMAQVLMERLNTARKRAREVRGRSDVGIDFFLQQNSPRSKCEKIMIFIEIACDILDYCMYLVFIFFFGVHWKNQCWFTLQVSITCFWLWEVFFGAENSGRLCWWKWCSKNASKNMTRYKIYMSCVVFVIRTARLFLNKYDCGICRMERYADLPQEYRRFVLRCFLSLGWQW